MLHKALITLILALLLMLLFFPIALVRAERIKDLAVAHGVRSNQLFGYGLSVGLKGTGDTTQSRFTLQSLSAMLGRMGVRIDPAGLQARNVAAVMVTADLPPFTRSGSRIDVVVSSIGNARSLQGGTLVFTPLRGADGKVYAVAQGPVSVGGFDVASQGATLSKNHTTVGRIPQGALVEQEVSVPLNDLTTLQLDIISPDFTTASRMTDGINKMLGADLATAVDPGTIQIGVPDDRKGKLVALMADIEALEVKPDAVARVVINERTGTVVIGSQVRIATVAIAHGNLHLQVSPRWAISQPNALGRGNTVTGREDDLIAKEDRNGLQVVELGATLGDVVKALNSIGASPRDLIEILQAIRAAGALPASLDIL